MNFGSAAFVMGVLALIGAAIFARLGLLRDYAIAMCIAVVLLIVLFFLDSFARSFLT